MPKSNGFEADFVSFRQRVIDLSPFFMPGRKNFDYDDYDELNMTISKQCQIDVNAIYDAFLIFADSEEDMTNRGTVAPNNWAANCEFPQDEWR